MEPCQLTENLFGYRDHCRHWCFDHLTTVARIIGFKRGTGSPSFLVKMPGLELFPKLWNLRTDI